ncbi:MAG TPA: hypothetical protein DEP84_36330 [Chloroflexi bacterium]|nr:hypothetical protein [Chloroflexota bacterium]
MHDSPPLRVFLALSLGAVAISVAAILIRWTDAPALVIATARLGIAALLIVPVGVLRAGDELRSLTRRDVALSALSGLFLAIHFISWITSLGLTSVASSVVLVTTSPLWAGVLAPLVSQDRLTRAMALGIVLATVGGIIVGAGDFTLAGTALRGDSLALLGAVMAALYLLAGRGVRRKVSLLGYITVSYSVAALVLLALALASGQRFGGYSSQTYPLLVLIAVVPQIIGHSSYNYALGWFSASFVAVALLAEPVGATILAALLLGEPITPSKVVGGLLILFGIYLAARGEEPRPGRAPHSDTVLTPWEEGA